MMWEQKNQLDAGGFTLRAGKYFCIGSGVMEESEESALANMRREYLQDALHRSGLLADPVEQFHNWFNAAHDAGVEDPTAMNLTTVDPDGWPSSRIVLLKGVDEEGFRFFTNYGSQKGREIEKNAQVALHFFWARLSRQVAIRGKVRKLPRQESKVYFDARPRESQISAWASCQSDEVSGREELEEAFFHCEEKFRDGKVPMPPDWGGFIVGPEFFEFWQGRPGRLHDRFVYTPDRGGDWKISRLAP